ncbi:MAG: hypothetical protein JSS75_07080 [Bacteroidetes bacterium]|nr:hypothetical protein [Bacteroidota bacterium]
MHRLSERLPSEGEINIDRVDEQHIEIQFDEHNMPEDAIRSVLAENGFKAE